MHGRRDGLCSERHAFYWNAFLLTFISVISASSSVSLEIDDVKLISSPNWPQDYPDNADRTYTIYSPEGSSVKVLVLDLLLEGICDFDTVYIYDGLYLK